MKLTPAQLAKHLQGPLAPVYVVSGDEPLLCQEACDAIRQACRERDFGERQVFNAEANFDWGLLLEAGASLSLFAEKRLIELRLPSGKPGDKGAAILQNTCNGRRKTPCSCSVCPSSMAARRRPSGPRP